MYDRDQPSLPGEAGRALGLGAAARWAWQDLKSNRGSTWLAVGVFAVTCAALCIAPGVIVAHIMVVVSESEKDQLASGAVAVTHLPSMMNNVVNSAPAMSFQVAYFGTGIPDDPPLQETYFGFGVSYLLALGGYLVFVLVAGLPVIVLAAFALSPALLTTMWRHQYVFARTAAGRPPAATTSGVASPCSLPSPALAQPSDLRKMVTIQGCMIGALGGVSGYILAPLWCLVFAVFTGVAGPGLAIMSLATGVVLACLAPIVGAGAGRIAYSRQRRAVAKSLVQIPHQQPIQAQPIDSFTENPAPQTRQPEENPAWVSFALAVGCWCIPLLALVFAIFWWPDLNHFWSMLRATIVFSGTTVAMFAGVVFWFRGTVRALSRWKERRKLSGTPSVFAISPGAASFTFVALMLCVSGWLWFSNMWAAPDLPQGLSPLTGVSVQLLWCIAGAWCTATWIATLPSSDVSCDGTQPSLPKTCLPPRAAQRHAARLALCAVCAGTWWQPFFIHEPGDEALLWALVVAWLTPLVTVPALSAFIAGKVANNMPHSTEALCSLK